MQTLPRWSLRTLPSPQKVFLIVIPTLSPRWLLICFLLLVLTFIGISFKWNHTVCHLMRLASFTYYDVFEIYPCCYMFQELMIVHHCRCVYYIPFIYSLAVRHLYARQLWIPLFYRLRDLYNCQQCISTSVYLQNINM